MELSLVGKVIVVTGGAKGIGASIVRLAGREGAFPVIFDCDEAAISQIQGELKRESVDSISVPVDLTDLAASTRALRDVVRTLGHIDGLVNNAGINDGVGLETGTPEKFTESLNKNLVHYYAMAHAALPFLKKTRGCIVNVASKIAVSGQGGTSGYAAAKGAILELTTEWAAELLSDGIRVNAVVPAEVMTPQYQTWLMKSSDPGLALERISARIPLGHRLTKAEEIAAAVIFLLSAQSGINGQQIFIDGGYVHLDRAIQ